MHIILVKKKQSVKQRNRPISGPIRSDPVRSGEYTDPGGGIKFSKSALPGVMLKNERGQYRNMDR